MWPQSDATLILSTELVSRHQVTVHGLQHHLVPGEPVLGQVDPGVPTLAYQLNQVIFSVNVNLETVSIIISLSR